MSETIVSVIIPAYGQAAFLGDAIRSVLEQTYPYFEVIVVNDTSPDESAAVVRTFDDPRIILLEHDTNRGLAAARNTGIKAAKGEFIALLDADDLFLQGKLTYHVDYLTNHPEVGATYNARYELHHSSSLIRSLYRPPTHVGLDDFLLGFPFAPSDLVVRSEWFQKVGGFDERLIYYGEDQDMYCRLALGGCAFGFVGHALNLRRHHSTRYDRHFSERTAHDREIITSVIDDPRCPPPTRLLADRALSNLLIVRAFDAFALYKTEYGQVMLQEAIQRNPGLLDGKPSTFEIWLAYNAAIDFNLDHRSILQSFMQQLPGELLWLADRLQWLITRGYLLRGSLAALWSQPADETRWLDAAAAHGAKLDDDFINWLNHCLIDIEIELGQEAAEEKWNRLERFLSQLENQTDVRRLKAIWSLNRSLRAYHEGRTSAAHYALDAVRNYPFMISNRGVLAVLRYSGASTLRSAIHRQLKRQDEIPSRS